MWMSIRVLNSNNNSGLNLYSTPNIFWVITSRRIRWAGHVARMGDGRDV